MRILVVIFTLLGMLGTGLFGFVMSEALSADKSSGGISAKEMSKQLDDTIKGLENGTIPAPDKDAAISGFKSVKGAIERTGMLPGVFYGAAGLGFLLMILSIFKVGPKVVHGVGFLLAGGVPLGLTMSIFSSLGRFEEFMKQIEPGTPPMLPAEQVQSAQLLILAFCGGLLLAGLSAFFVKRED